VQKGSLAMTVLVVAQFMDLMDAMITNVALPSIQRDIGATAAQLEWTLSAYVLMFAVVLVTGGRLGDVLGRRSVFLVGVLGFSAASLAASISETGSELVAARAAQGLCAALMVPQVLSTAQALYRPDERGKIFGLMGALGGIGVLTGQLLGGFMVTHDAFGIGWRSVFVINVPLGLLIAVLSLLVVPNTRSSKPVSVDWIGAILSTTGATLVVFPLIESNSQGWTPRLWALLAAGPVVLAVFVGHQLLRARLGRAPVLPMRLFAFRGFSAAAVVQIANYVGWGSFALMIPLYLQDGLGDTALTAGLIMLPVTVGSFIGTTLAPLAARLGRAAVVAGGIVEAAGFAWYELAIRRAGDALTVWSLAGPLALTGVGMILLAVPLMGLALEQIDVDDAGAASGTFSMLQQLGNALGISLAGVAFFHVLPGRPSPSDYRHAIETGNWITIAAFAVAAAAALALPAHTPRDLGRSDRKPSDRPRSREVV
jgi:EmrB/QacA subfamily drug resistance transporter